MDAGNSQQQSLNEQTSKNFNLHAAVDPQKAVTLYQDLCLSTYAQLVSFFRVDGAMTDFKRIILQYMRKLMGITDERHRIEMKKAYANENLSKVAKALNNNIDPDIGWQEESNLTVDDVDVYDNPPLLAYLTNIKSAYLASEYKKNLWRTRNANPPKRPSKQKAMTPLYNFKSFYQSAYEHFRNQLSTDSEPTKPVDLKYKTLAVKRCNDRPCRGATLKSGRQVRTFNLRKWHENVPKNSALDRAARHARRNKELAKQTLLRNRRKPLSTTRRRVKEVSSESDDQSSSGQVSIAESSSVTTTAKVSKQSNVVKKSETKKRDLYFKDDCIYNTFLAEQYDKSDAAHRSPATAKEMLKLARSKKVQRITATLSDQKSDAKKSNESECEAVETPAPVVVVHSQSAESSRALVSKSTVNAPNVTKVTVVQSSTVNTCPKAKAASPMIAKKDVKRNHTVELTKRQFERRSPPILPKQVVRIQHPNPPVQTVRFSQQQNGIGQDASNVIKGTLTMPIRLISKPVTSENRSTFPSTSQVMVKRIKIGNQFCDVSSVEKTTKVPVIVTSRSSHVSTARSEYPLLSSYMPLMPRTLSRPVLLRLPANQRMQYQRMFRSSLESGPENNSLSQSANARHNVAYPTTLKIPPEILPLPQPPTDPSPIQVVQTVPVVLSSNDSNRSVSHVLKSNIT